MKKFLSILVWVLTVGGVSTAWVFTYKEHVEHPLNGVKMTLLSEVKNGFVDYDAVYQTVMDICDTVNNKNVTQIPLDSVRNYVSSIPWVISSEANISLNETMVVELVECQPVMRVYNTKGRSVYLDAEGRVFPVSPRYTPHVLVGSGNLKFPIVTKSSSSINDNLYANTDLPKMFDVMRKVLDNSYTRCCVKQVYYSKDMMYELAMNNVDLEVVLGCGDDVDDKLMNLQCFFEQMQGNPDLKGYGKVNFNFENQVVCTKNIKK